jgi:hypothetical protein
MLIERDSLRPANRSYAPDFIEIYIRDVLNIELFRL